MSKPQNSCRNCIFCRSGKCVFGIRRHWNLSSCSEFVPYCANCTFPELFCNTCPNRTMRLLRPELPLGPVDRPVYQSRYDCVWR